MDVTQLTSVDESEAQELNALLTQLSSKGEAKNRSRDALHEVATTPTTEVWVAKDGGKIVGMACLVLVVLPEGTNARVEDVVVDGSQRGKGLGQILSEKIIERARARGASTLYLSSKPAREAANSLYQKLGFEQYETNTYKLQL